MLRKTVTPPLAEGIRSAVITRDIQLKSIEGHSLVHALPASNLPAALLPLLEPNLSREGHLCMRPPADVMASVPYIPTPGGLYALRTQTSPYTRHVKVEVGALVQSLCI